MGTKPQNILQLYTISECHALMLWENIRAVSEELHTICVPEVEQNGCPTLRAHFYLLDYYVAMYFHALPPLNILIWTKYSIYLLTHSPSLILQTFIRCLALVRQVMHWSSFGWVWAKHSPCHRKNIIKWKRKLCKNSNDKFCKIDVDNAIWVWKRKPLGNPVTNSKDCRRNVPSLSVEGWINFS